MIPYFMRYYSKTIYFHQTEQTMTELEIELNEKIGSEWNIIQEAGFQHYII